MKIRDKTYVSVCIVLMALGALCTHATAEEKNPGIEVGVLTCHSVPDTRKNLLINSTVGVECELKYNKGTEKYVGESGIGLGVDLNWKRDEHIVYTVLAASSDMTPGGGALAGKYAGAKGSATLGYGVGAAVLVGGGENNFSLQPLALEGSKGLGVAGGLAYLYLEPAK